jgi:hypothetical protein
VLAFLCEESLTRVLLVLYRETRRRATVALSRVLVLSMYDSLMNEYIHINSFQVRRLMCYRDYQSRRSFESLGGLVLCFLLSIPQAFLFPISCARLQYSLPRRLGKFEYRRIHSSRELSSQGGLVWSIFIRCMQTDLLGVLEVLSPAVQDVCVNVCMYGSLSARTSVVHFLQSWPMSSTHPDRRCHYQISRSN